jgi:hypothetical protein
VNRVALGLVGLLAGFGLSVGALVVRLMLPSVATGETAGDIRRLSQIHSMLEWTMLAGVPVFIMGLCILLSILAQEPNVPARSCATNSDSGAN